MGSEIGISEEERSETGIDKKEEGSGILIVEKRKVDS